MARIGMTNFDYKTGIGLFTVQSVSDLEFLPRYGIAGQDILNTVKSVNFGSKAFVIDSGKRYILNSENKWQEITISSSGGSGGAGDSSDLPNYVEITNDEIVSWFEDDNV